MSELISLGNAKYREFRRAAAGTERPVLWEAPHHGSEMMHGFTDNYLRVAVPHNPLLVNTITNVRIGEPIDGDSLSAVII